MDSNSHSFTQNLCERWGTCILQTENLVLMFFHRHPNISYSCVAMAHWHSWQQHGTQRNAELQLMIMVRQLRMPHENRAAISAIRRWCRALIQTHKHKTHTNIKSSTAHTNHYNIWTSSAHDGRGSSLLDLCYAVYESSMECERMWPPFLCISCVLPRE